MNAILAWGLSQGANALNIVAGIIVAHLASPYEFGRFATLSAAITIMTAVVNPMINEVAQRVALRGAIDSAALGTRTRFAVATCITIAVCACTSIVTDGIETIVVCVLIPIFLVQHSWATGFFYGLHRMVAFGAVLCVGGIFRIATLLALIYLGATFSGVTLSYLATFMLTIIGARYLFAQHKRCHDSDAWNTNWTLLCGFFLLALPFSVDQPIIQALHPDISADYAALMTYARSVVLLAGPALSLLYSASLREVTSAAQGSVTPRHFSYLTIAVLLSAVLALLLWAFHPFLFPLLLGEKYVHVTPHIAWALLGMTFYVISSLLAQRLLLSCEWWLCAALAVPPVLQGLLLTLQTTPSLSQLVTVSVVTFSLQCIITLATTTMRRRGLCVGEDHSSLDGKNG